MGDGHAHEVDVMVGDPTGPGRPRLRILVVSDILPWPARDGYRLRLQAAVSALASIAEVELFVGAYPGDDADGTVPETVARWQCVPAPQVGISPGELVRTTLSRVPRRILWRDWGPAQVALRRFARPPYDLVWYSHATAYAGLGHPSLGPAVVDLDNLESFIARSRPVGSLREVGPRAWVRDLLRAGPRALLDARDTRCWDHLEHAIADQVAAAVVCSALDRRRLGAPNVAVIPNGYPDPGVRDYVPERRSGVVMVGRFTYEPNLQGVQWLVREVLPTLHEEAPDACVRLVGRHDGRLDAIAVGPGVTVVGEVEEVGPELGAARAVAVPLLAGSGTRIKVLEALAYGLPVVTTSIGCEGIDITPGIHALVHDEPAEFARALARVLHDDALCRALSEQGRALYVERYEADSIADRVREVARGASGGDLVER